MNIQNHNGFGLLRAGVVGVGAFGRHHAAKYARMAGVELAAVADLNAETRRTVATAHGAEAHADWRDLLGKVDIVSVCSPAITHAPIVRAFLDAGAHVLVEKPIATNLKEADRLIALAETKNRVLTVGHQERFVFARTGLLDYDAAPLQIECWRAGPWTGRGADVSAVLDLMIHDLDLVHQMIPGGVGDVRARGRATHGRLADEVSALVNFENGAQARLVASRISDKRRRGMRAVYADGTIEIDFLSRQVKNTTARPLNDLELDDPLGESITAFVKAARMGSGALVRPEEARRALETALLIDEASAPYQGRAPEEYALTA
ncbi:MAG TPA: Gfo/Idh/MocA family oxidoreductase [Rhizomicrobium sp.]|nr:Gfo/Idh/MocA family oxidoreductase [Rhizomicrobium sp.]